MFRFDLPGNKKPKEFLIISEGINRFVPNVSFLYPLKTIENRKVLWCFQEVIMAKLQKVKWS